MDRQLKRSPKKSNSRYLPNLKSNMNRTFEHVEKPPRVIPEGCICQRPRCMVLCSFCGYQILNRVRITCSVHPKTTFLMDLDRCPQCLGYASFLKEFPLE